MCRVCMAEAEDLLDMYDRDKTHIDDRLSQALKKLEEPEPSLPELLKECSPICVESDDPFPKKVCDPCLRKLRDAVYFHRRYAKSMDYIGRVKLEKKDQEILNDIEQEEWDLKSENPEEADEDQENKVEGEDDDEDSEEESDDFEDDEDEYLPVPKKRRTKPGSLQCQDCHKTFTTQAQLTIHSADHNKEATKLNGTNTRPKRRSAKY
ncbi:acidic leucine-rich nuclear phosphoprotein 32 family member B [Drosophila serrata]|uniref:acidic leucine-rich nuclear phosphoprotein 32 family member B n=1 Tax=Drosophila serrata TaxID=7274 RepID=UPI000A1D0F9A|nr:acidic leucine-rich nuclear phosphoprotein 32 family member B [Drosophila serrata]